MSDDQPFVFQILPSDWVFREYDITYDIIHAVVQRQRPLLLAWLAEHCQGWDLIWSAVDVGASHLVAIFIAFDQRADAALYRIFEDSIDNRPK